MWIAVKGKTSKRNCIELVIERRFTERGSGILESYINFFTVVVAIPSKPIVIRQRIRVVIASHKLFTFS